MSSWTSTEYSAGAGDWSRGRRRVKPGRRPLSCLRHERQRAEEDGREGPGGVAGVAGVAGGGRGRTRMVADAGLARTTLEKHTPRAQWQCDGGTWPCWCWCWCWCRGCGTAWPANLDAMLDGHERGRRGGRATVVSGMAAGRASMAWRG